MKQALKITLVQSPLAWENPKANLEYFDGILKKDKVGDVVVLPEMFTTGFSMKPEKNAEAHEGVGLLWMKKKAKELGAFITGSICVQDGGQHFNRLYFVGADGNYKSYNKRHLFRMGSEQNHYEGGKEKIIVEVNGWKILPLVCYDLRFPVWSRNSWQKTGGSWQKAVGSEQKEEGSEQKEEGSEQKEEGSEQKEEGSGQKAVGSEQKEVGSEQKEEGSGQKAVGSEQKTGGSEQKAVGSGQKEGGSGQKAVGSEHVVLNAEYDVLIYIANWPEARSYAWKQLLIARAIENQCYVVGVNRIGADGSIVMHSGDSMVVNPLGEIISTTKAHQENVETVTLDGEFLQGLRKKFPVGLDADPFELQ